MKQIEAAIAATEPTTTLREVRVQIASTGRPVILLVPDDLADAEVIELGAAVLIGLRPQPGRAGVAGVAPVRAWPAAVRYRDVRYRAVGALLGVVPERLLPLVPYRLVRWWGRETIRRMARRVP